MAKLSLSIIMPVYNEEKTVVDAINTVVEKCDHGGN